MNNAQSPYTLIISTVPCPLAPGLLSFNPDHPQMAMPSPAQSKNSQNVCWLGRVVLRPTTSGVPWGVDIYFILNFKALERRAWVSGMQCWFPQIDERQL